jgi:hypothetical protein
MNNVTYLIAEFSVSCLGVSHNGLNAVLSVSGDFFSVDFQVGLLRLL